MSKPKGSWSIQIREYLENNKLNLGLSSLSFTVSIILLVVSLAQKTPSFTAAAVTGKPKTFETVCLDCLQLFTESQYPYLTESLLNQLSFQIKDDHRQCCFNNTDLIELLLQMLMKNEKRVPTLTDQEKVDRTQTVATHKKLLQAVNKETKFPGDHIYLTFAVNNEQHEFTSGVTVTPENLIIKFTGLYYIYCSVRFHHAVNTTKKNNYATFVHRASPYNPSGTGVLLKSVHTALHITTETTFTGGIFVLHEGDRVQVCVTDSDVIDFKSQSTFIGLFLLASHQS